jgi:hypothetical protein
MAISWEGLKGSLFRKLKKKLKVRVPSPCRDAYSQLGKGSVGDNPLINITNSLMILLSLPLLLVYCDCTLTGSNTPQYSPCTYTSVCANKFKCCKSLTDPAKLCRPQTECLRNSLLTKAITNPYKKTLKIYSPCKANNKCQAHSTCCVGKNIPYLGISTCLPKAECIGNLLFKKSEK